MRSLLWTGVFVLLMIELCVTMILVLPVPNKFRNAIVLAVSRLELKRRFMKFFVGIFLALLFALLDTATFLSNIYSQKEQERHQHQQEQPFERHRLKEQEYKAGRNLYLVAFALTLLFVIGRITELMQEHAELAGKIENLKIAVEMAASSSNENDKDNTDGNDAPTEGIEMSSMGIRKRR